MEINKDYFVTSDNAPFTFTLNYVVPSEPGTVTDPAKTGDDLGFLVIALAVVAVAGLGYVIYRITRKNR